MKRKAINKSVPVNALARRITESVLRDLRSSVKDELVSGLDDALHEWSDSFEAVMAHDLNVDLFDDNGGCLIISNENSDPLRTVKIGDLVSGFIAGFKGDWNQISRYEALADALSNQANRLRAAVHAVQD